jgi:putative oxidoreductase
VKSIILLGHRLIAALSGRRGEGIALLLVRVALAGVFWRSGRSKVVEGSWLEISDSTRFLFENDYSGVPLPPEFAAVAATYSEHLFPVLLVAGLATRLSALALLGMTLVIQIFVFPEAWWSVHMIWAAMAAILISRGGGLFALDRLLPTGRDRA